MSRFTRVILLAVMVALFAVSISAQTTIPTSSFSFNIASSDSMIGPSDSSDAPVSTAVQTSSLVCRVKFCRTCTTGNATSCSVCNTGYKKTAQNLCTQQCRVISCRSCYASTNTKCATCNSGYKRNANYLCVRVRRTTTVTKHAAAAPASLLLAAGAMVASAVALLL